MKTSIGFLWALASCLSAWAQTGPDLFQQALRKEQVDGDLKSAIALYQRVAVEHAGNRQLAAQALLHLGQGYEKLGAGEAKAAYERLVRDYADQTGPVATAQNRLKALATSGASSGSGQPLIRMLISEKTDKWVPFGEANPSPNGRYLAYVNWGHGNLGMYDIETGNLRDLTSEGTWSGTNQFAWSGVWSPDNATVAYNWMIGERGELRVVGREGGAPRTLVSENLVPQSWTATGRQIVALGPNAKPAPGKPPLPEGIVLVDVGTGRTHPIHRFTSAHPDQTLSLSPDGQWIAYSAPQAETGKTESGAMDIRIVRIDGTADRLLAENPANDTNPQWMPDGEHLLFLSNRSGEKAIWAVRVADGTAKAQPRLIRASKSRNLGVAQDGTVFFNENAPNFNILVADVDFEKSDLGAPKVVSLGYDGKNRMPAWSSDGRKLGYVSMRSPAVLVMQDAKSGTERDLEVDWYFSDRVAWSPDLGRLIGPAPKLNKGGNGLFKLDVSTGRRTSLIEPMDDCGWPTFTPDGKFLIYTKFSWTSNALPNQTIELDLTTMRERFICDDLAGYYTPVAVSPDGKLLAACKNVYPGKEGDMLKVAVTSRAEGKTSIVAEFPYSRYERGHVFGWAPDNRQVILSLNEKQKPQQLYLVNIENGQTRPFGPPQPTDEPIRAVSVHPDGRRIAFERGRMARELWAMKNFLPADAPAQ